MYAPSQWEIALQCNAISHWQGTYTEWSLGPLLWVFWRIDLNWDKAAWDSNFEEKKSCDESHNYKVDRKKMRMYHWVTMHCVLWVVIITWLPDVEIPFTSGWSACQLLRSPQKLASNQCSNILEYGPLLKELGMPHWWLCLCKTAVSPLLKHWGYCSLVLSQWHVYSLINWTLLYTTEQLYEWTIKFIHWKNVVSIRWLCHSLMLKMLFNPKLNQSTSFERCENYEKLEIMLHPCWYYVQSNEQVLLQILFILMASP